MLKLLLLAGTLSAHTDEATTGRVLTGIRTSQTNATSLRRLYITRTPSFTPTPAVRPTATITPTADTTPRVR